MTLLLSPPLASYSYLLNTRGVIIRGGFIDGRAGLEEFKEKEIREVNLTTRIDLVKEPNKA